MSRHFSLRKKPGVPSKTLAKEAPICLVTTVCLPLGGLAYQSKEHFLSLLGNSVQNPTMLTENTCAGPTVQLLSFSTGRNCGESRRQIPPAKTFSSWPLPAAGRSASVPIRAPNGLDPHLVNVIFYYPIVSGYFCQHAEPGGWRCTGSESSREMLWGTPCPYFSPGAS